MSALIAGVRRGQQLEGACCGYSGIPKDWLSKIVHHDLIMSMAEKLHGISTSSQYRETLVQSLLKRQVTQE